MFSSSAQVKPAIYSSSDEASRLLMDSDSGDEIPLSPSDSDVDAFLHALLGENRRVLPLSLGDVAEVTERDTVESDAATIATTKPQPNAVKVVNSRQEEQHEMRSASEDAKADQPLQHEFGADVSSASSPNASDEGEEVPLLMSRASGDPKRPSISAVEDRNVFLVPTLQMSLRASFIKALVAVNETMTDKKQAQIQAAITALRGGAFDINTSSLRDLLMKRYDGEHRLADALRIKRGAREATTIGRVLLATWENFSAENPASLMRPYVFLQQLLEPAVAFSGSYEKSTRERFAGIRYAIKEFRRVFKAMFHSDSSVTFKTISDNIERLKKLATDHPSFAIHARLLAVFILDKMEENNFWLNIWRDHRDWLMVGGYSFGVSSEKSAFLSRVVSSLQQEPTVQKHGISAWRTALVEMSAYQPEHSSNTDTSQQHEAKVNAFISHIERCEEKYISHPILRMQAPPEKVALTPVASVLKNITDGKVTTFTDNGSGLRGKHPRLRLVKNVGAVQQAALHWGVQECLTTQTTLALMSVGTPAVLRDRARYLGQQATYVERVNSVLIISALDGDIAALQELFESTRVADVSTGAFVDCTIDARLNADEKLRYYQAFLDVADSALRYWQDEQAIFSEDLAAESLLVKLYSAIYKCLSYLHSVMMTQEVRDNLGLLNQLREKLKEKDIGLTDKDMPLLGESIRQAHSRQGIEKRSPKETTFWLKLQVVLQDQMFRHVLNLSDVITRAETYDALDQRTKQFIEQMAKTDNSSIKNSVFKETHDPYSLLFLASFSQALENNQIDFFIKMLFSSPYRDLPTNDSYKTPVEMAQYLCGRVAGIYNNDADYVDEGVCTLWNAFVRDGFYGNNAACVGLIDHYLNEDATEERLRSVMLIVTFVLLHKSFDKCEHAVRVKFSLYFIDICAKLQGKLSEEAFQKFIRKHYVVLSPVFLTLYKDERLISEEELLHLKALEQLMSDSNDSNAVYHRLLLNARMQDGLHQTYSVENSSASSRQDELLMGLEMKYHPEPVPTREPAVPQPMSQAEAIQLIAVGANDQLSHYPEESKTAITKIRADIKGLAQAMSIYCFPEGYRYYRRGATVQNSNEKNDGKFTYKLTWHEGAGQNRQPLEDMCYQALMTVIQNKDFIQLLSLNLPGYRQTMRAARLGNQKSLPQLMLETAVELRLEVLQGGSIQTLESRQRRLGPVPGELVEGNLPDRLKDEILLTIVQKAIAAITQPAHMRDDASGVMPLRGNRVDLVISERPAVDIETVVVASSGNSMGPVSEVDKLTAMYECIDWLLDNPQPNNIPGSVSKILDAAQIDETRIQYYRKKLLYLKNVNKFLQRIRLIKLPGQLPHLTLCIDHVLEDETPEGKVVVVVKDTIKKLSVEPGFNLSELHRFLEEFDTEDNVDQYDAQRDQFVWAIAKKYVLSDNEVETEQVLSVLNTCGYSWYRIVALGFQFYVEFSELLRCQHGSDMLKTVIKLTLNNLTEPAFQDTLHHRDAVIEMARDELEEVLQKVNIEPDELRSTLGESGQRKSTVTMRTDVAVYFYINVLAQAWMHIAIDSNPTQKVGASLLLKGFGDLRNDADFAKWHQSMLVLGKNYPESFLYILVKGHTESREDKYTFYLPVSKDDAGCVSRAQRSLTSVYKEFYEDQRENNAFIHTTYEQHAEEALRFLVSQPYCDNIKNEKMQSTLVEQVAFIFDVMKDVREIFDVDPAQSWHDINCLSPHLNALYAVANGAVDGGFFDLSHRDREVKSEARNIMLNTLFPKACDGFNHLMSTIIRKEQVINARTAALLEYLKSLLKDYACLRDEYLKHASSCLMSADENHVRFILELTNLSLNTRGKRISINSAVVVVTSASEAAQNIPEIITQTLLPKLYDIIHAQLLSEKDVNSFSEKLQLWLGIFANNNVLNNYFTHVVAQGISVVSTFSNNQRERYAAVLLWGLCAYTQHVEGMEEVIKQFVVSLWKQSCKPSGQISRSGIFSSSTSTSASLDLQFYDRQVVVLQTLCQQKALPPEMLDELRKLCNHNDVTISKVRK